jgi:hypothetical protein
METQVAEYEREFVHAKTVALETNPFDPHAVYRAVVGNPKVTHFSKATHMLDEWGFKAQKNRDKIATFVASKFGVECKRTHDCVFTQLQWQRKRGRMLLYTDAAPPEPNTYIAYEDPRLPVNVLARHRIPGDDHQGAACVARLNPTRTTTDAHVFGSERIVFDPIQKIERDQYMMSVDIMLQPICVRVSTTDYDDWWTETGLDALF